LAEYHGPATALLEHYRGLQASYRFDKQISGGQTRVATATVICDRENYVCQGGIRVIDSDGKVVSESPDTVIARNRLYEFELRNQSDRGYALNRVSHHAERHSPWSAVLVPFADPWRCRTYLDLVSDPDSVVHVVRRAPWRGRQVVQIEVEYAFRDQPALAPRRVKGCYCFDPSASWVCVGEWSVPSNPSERSRYEGVYHYATRDGWPVLTRDELWEVKVGDSGAGRLLRASDYDDYSAIPPRDESAFRLAAFGLPEPVGVEWPRRRSGWLWLAGAAVGCVVIGAVFVALRRRAARRQPAAAQPSAT
jgi:hypothetical protein